MLNNSAATSASCDDGASARLRGCFVLQVRKELEMGGIEFYPQKEFDEDMEDKSDNDKIRVSTQGLFHHFFLSSQSSFPLDTGRYFMHVLKQVECSPE